LKGTQGACLIDTNSKKKCFGLIDVRILSEFESMWWGVFMFMGVSIVMYSSIFFNKVKSVASFT